MATALIHSENGHFCETCRAYFKVSGHTVTDSGPVDVAIIDFDHRAPPEVEAGILVCISAWECKLRHLPKRALFKLKPVDVDAMMDWILKMLEQTV